MTDEPDPLDTALRSLPLGDDRWPQGGELRTRAGRRHRRRVAARTGATVVAAGVAVAVIGTTLAGGGPARTGPTRQIAGPVGTYQVAVATEPLPGDTTHLVAHVEGRALPAAGTATTRATAEAEVAFGLRLTQRLAGAGTANVVDSPLSADVALSMLELGARGSTAAGIAEALQAPHLTADEQAIGWSHLLAALATPAKGVTLAVASSAWLQRHVTFSAAYLAGLAQTFGDDAYQADFSGHGDAATAAINAWVSRRTAGRITTLFPPGSLPAATTLVLANAVHFKAAWSRASSMVVGPPESFVGDDGARHEVATISTGGQPSVPVAVTPTYTAVELPYAGGRYQAEIVEPTAAKASTFLAGLTPAALGRISASLHPATADVTMPSLSLTGLHPLDDVLSSMGMGRAFGDADLSGISPAVGNVSRVVQATQLVVDQHGTDAAAATGISFASSARIDAHHVVIDRPYLLVLRDRTTGLVLMSALVENPSAG